MAPQQANSNEDKQIALQALFHAREYASRDSHQGAIAAYRAAFQRDSLLIAKYAHELGHQLTWGDQPADAIPWYHRRLKAAADDTDARLGLARALSWTDQIEAAKDQYRIILEAHPDEIEARQGLARMLAWQDRLPEAIETHEAILKDHPENLSSRLALAQCINWLGQHERAQAAYREILRSHPDHSEALLGLAYALYWGEQIQEALAILESVEDSGSTSELEKQWRAHSAPSLEVIQGYSHDSDDLDITTTTLLWEMGSGSRQSWRLAMSHRRLEQVAQPEITGKSMTAGGARRLGSDLAIHAYLNLHSFSSDDPITGTGSTSDLDFLLLGLDSWMSWIPRSSVRVDLSADRSYVEPPRALGNEIAVNSLALSTDLRPRRFLSLHAMLRGSDYSDGNRRIMGKLSSTLRRSGRWQITFVPSVAHFRFSESVDNGYWNPSSFWNADGMLRVEKSFLKEKLMPMLETHLGREYDGDQSYSVFGWTARLRYFLAKQWRLEIAGGSSDSQLSSSAGYRRSWAHLALRHHF